MKEVDKVNPLISMSITLGLFILIISIVVGIFVFIPSLNPFIPQGQVVGIFIEGYHEGFGDFCGDYPNSGIRFTDTYYNEEHFPFSNDGWFYFGNQYSGIDKMIVGQEYTIWYHQESRPANTTDSEAINYWVVYDVKP